MKFETEAILRVPPGGQGATGQSNGAQNAQVLSLVANATSAVTTVLLAVAPDGCFVTFRAAFSNTTAVCIRFGTITAGPDNSTANDYEIPPGGSEEWVCTNEVNFTAFSTATASLKWYRSSK